MTDSRPGAWDSANTIAHFEQYGVETAIPPLVPYLSAGAQVLDVGCGPGTITIDVARRIGTGAVTSAAGFAYRGSEWFESKLGFLRFVVGLDDSDPSFIGTAHRKLLDAGLVEAELIAAAQSDVLNWSEHPEAFLMIAGIFVAGRVHA